MSILARIEQLRAEGHDVVSLTAGEPGSGAPPAVNAAAAALHAGNTVLNYSPALGIAPLREALAAHYASWYAVDLPMERVAVTTGSSGAFMLSFLAAFDVGDRVALARPGYPAYRNILSSLGIEVVDLDCGPEVRFQPTPAQLEDEVAGNGPLAGLIIASPANPTGTMVDRHQLSELSRWCAGNGVQLISDEIYHGITYDGVRCRSARAFSDRAVVVGSVSKYFSMTGWRLGWAVVPPDLLRAVERLASNMTVCPPTVSQVAALAAFDDESIIELDGHVERYARNREVLLTGLADLGITRTAPADGAFYVYADLGHLTDDSAAWCAELLDRTGVAVVPGLDFDTVDGRRSVRFSFAGSTEDMHEALTRVAPHLRR